MDSLARSIPGAAHASGEEIKLMIVKAFRRRLKAVLVLGPCVALLAAGWALKPRACGYGTAQQLGLPGCGMLARTGWFCPSCGLTTSVAAAVHGDLPGALRAQVFGVVMVLAALAVGGAALIELVSGRDVLGAFHLGWW
ncbi:MAG: DUF2752 domain-containing protein, partial [Planctomycetes bacterium]|nr:DUF2752 domain-containing protein [Planctomycetota bacterium]